MAGGGVAVGRGWDPLEEGGFQREIPGQTTGSAHHGKADPGRLPGCCPGLFGRSASVAHLYSILGEEGAGISLHGELQAGGIPPERAASEEQVGSPFLAAAVAFAKEVWEREVHGRDRTVSKETM